MSDRFERRAPWVPWAIASAVLVVVAVAAYSAGVRHEVVVDPTGPVRVWHHGGFPGWFFFVFLFFFLAPLRWLMWGGWGPRHYHPWRRTPYGYDDDRDAWAEWHRREHERTDGRASGRESSRSNDRGSLT
jgi:hypothetical protein